VGKRQGFGEARPGQVAALASAALKRRGRVVDSFSMSSSSDTVRIMCPNLTCRRILAVPAAARGKTVRCKNCTMNIRVPAQPPAQAAPPAAAAPEGGAGPAKK
jgi:hypothetical protein